MALLSPTLSRIYTPPTCTLEVMAQPSALSRWTRTPAIKSLQFLLSLDGLQPNRREPLEIRGDQTQLTNLTETVSDYIQQLLARCHTDLPLNVATLPPSDPDLSPSLQIHPRTLLTHELVLGDLATDQSGPSVVLKVSQLYDLATALEDCTADLQQLPDLVVTTPWRTALLPIAQHAAMVLLTVGLGTATWRLLQFGPTAMNQAARSPSSKTAMAPKDPFSADTKSLPSPKKAESSPLVLPQVQLPSRSSTPLTQNRVSSDGNPKNKPDFLGTARSSAAPSSGTLQSLPSEPSNLPPQQEIALAPAAPSAPITQSSSAESSQQADATASAPASAVAGADTIRDRAVSRMSKAAPNNGYNNKLSQKTLFDTTTQVAEVRDYVVSRWQPTPPPPKTLEYRVTLNRNGSLAKVEPLGVSAQQYLNKLPLPSGQATFVSPLESGAPSTIRLILHQDGTVQTFLDP
jgi:hypothetical protein